jgi:hypothetical protein
MKKYFSICLQVVFLCIFSIVTVGCDKEDKDFEYEDKTTSKVSAPTFDKYLTTTDTDGFSIRLRFTNGGDDRENMSCQVYWKAFSSKPSSTPSERDLTKSEQMRIYNHTKTKTTFDKSHAGYNGGTYIYYYAVCKNSKGSCKTNITYTIVKR